VKRRGRHSSAGACLLLTAALVGACKAKPAPERPPQVTKPAPAVLVGSVRLSAGFELPSYQATEMERKVLRHVGAGDLAQECTPFTVEDRQPVKLTSDGKLTGVSIIVTEFSIKPPELPIAYHDVAIRNCRLTPSLVVARINDVLRIKNEMTYPFMPGLAIQSFNQTLLAGQTKEFKLDQGGSAIPLTCGLTSPCGRTDIIVVAHPYFAVTDQTGEFRIADFPPDETVQVHAWHPLFDQSPLSVKVSRGEEKRVEFTLTPRPPPKPTEPPKRDPNDKTVYPQ
jgi:hypothetical protein